MIPFSSHRCPTMMVLSQYPRWAWHTTKKALPQAGALLKISGLSLILGYPADYLPYGVPSFIIIPAPACNINANLISASRSHVIPVLDVLLRQPYSLLPCGALPVSHSFSETELTCGLHLTLITSPYPLFSMRLRKLTGSLLSLSLLALICSGVAAKKDDPKISTTQFQTAPTNLLYFDDSDTILVQEKDVGNVRRSTDAGATWDRIKDIDEGQAWEVWLHPYDNKIAYTLGIKSEHWVTHDQGETWISFNTEDAVPSLVPPPLSFHAGDSKKALLHAQSCSGWSCDIFTYYTTDGFKTKKLLRDNTRACYFARATPLFQTSSDDENDQRVLCVVKGKYSPRPKDYRLVVSDDYFEENEYEPPLDGERTVQGLISMAVIKGFIVAAAKAEGTDELALYVTDDAKTWHQAEFPSSHKVKENAYTILESTNYSIQVDVMNTRPTSSMGVLFNSNSNGTYFTKNIEHTNRNFLGIVDFEKIQDIQGIVLINVVDNWEEVEQSGLSQRHVKSKISFDDGRTFQSITAGKKDLHLHSVTDMSNSGRVYSSAAPGIAMGIGNTGDSLKKYTEGDLYVSDDAGLTWKKSLDEAHKYEFGDQGSILLAVYDEGPTDKISYSINHGKTWSTAKLEEKIRPRLLTTTPDSTSLKFILVGAKGRGDETEFYIYSIDFKGLHERKCGAKDFEDWYARVDDDGKPGCVMGHTQKYRRRIADADCFIDDEFKDPMPVYESCKCSREDFECDYNFVPDKEKKQCEPAEALSVPEDQCKSAQGTFMGSSGYRLIPGNACKGGVNLAEEIERQCTDTVKKPATGDISSEITSFSASNFMEYYYLERTSTSQGDDETVIMRTSEDEVYLSRDHGKTWKPILKDAEIVAIVPHQYFNDVIYFLTSTEEVWSTVNRGETFEKFKAPNPPNRDSVASSIAFHPDFKDYLLWTGSVNCDSTSDGPCHLVASYSKERGDKWDTLLRYVRHCEFIKREGRGKSESDSLLYCEQHKDEKLDGTLQLLSSDNFFANSETHFKDIIAFATMSEFIVVAAKDEGQFLKLDASVDGKTFADAQFPNNLHVDHQQAYTVLDSSTHAVFVNVMVGMREDFEYGTIIKSNSNGTSYVLSVSEVNRNSLGYVDFEKMLGMEGVAMVNIVENVKDEDKSGKKKLLKTLITHNDGAEWAPLAPPQKDADDKPFECDTSNPQGCSLHLHGYTERRDPRSTFSSPSAIGLMMGVGNVGAYLTRKEDADTFITSDGGISWRAVMKGNYMWEYGDQGSIVVIVKDRALTKEVLYSRDEGATWNAYEFSDKEMRIQAITTVPSDNSRNFLLWSEVDGKDVRTINLDFSGLTNKECVLDEENPTQGDYYLWAPKHPLQQDDCLFGHIAQYHRKKPTSDCYNGKKFEHLHKIARNCSCTRQDFEW